MDNMAIVSSSKIKVTAQFYPDNCYLGIGNALSFVLITGIWESYDVG